VKSSLRIMLVTALSCVVLASWIQPAAATSTVSVDDLTLTESPFIGASKTLPIFGINLTGTDTFTQLKVDFTDLTNPAGGGTFDIATDLEASPLGIAVYRDSSRTGANEDAFDPGDTRVSTNFTFSGLNATVTVNSAMPSAAEGKYTYFLVIQSSAGIGNGDAFNVSLPASAFTTSLPLFPTFPVGITSQTITADTVDPIAQIAATPTGPAGKVIWQFSEAVSGVSYQNVVLRLGGTTTTVPSTVAYDPDTLRATLTPASPLTYGVTYDAVVAPGGSPAITDRAGNQVATTTMTFQVFHPSFTPGFVRGNTWYLNNGFDSFAERSFSFGRSTDKHVVGDWNGDGIFTPGVVRGNVWYLSNSFSGTADIVFAFGRSTDIPVVGDWNGDGIYTPGVVRGNTWYLTDSFGGPATSIFTFGRAGDLPIAGDWNGDQVSDIGVVRGNTWYLATDAGSTLVGSFSFGRPTDVRLVGDWNGDGVWTPGIVRGGTWYLVNSFGGPAEVVFTFGSSTDSPVVGAWNA